ncbi:MAG: BBP7 family outer membrane beta-barrel protein [Planctomycetaceae bacterium]
MTARLKLPLVIILSLAACASAPDGGRARAAGFRDALVPPVFGEAGETGSEPLLIGDEIVLDSEGDGGSAATPVESILTEDGMDGDMMSPVVESVAEPRVLDVSSRPLSGMLLDDFNLDEMPFEASSGRWFWNGGWYVGGESLWMDRSRETRTVIARDTYPLPIKSLQFFAKFPEYTTAAQPFNTAPGARATIGKSLGRDYLDRDRFLEFVYYGGMAYNDNDGFNAVGQQGFQTPLDYFAPGFNGAGTFNTWFNSDFNSWEWNYKLRRRLGRDQLVMSPGGNWTRHAERGWLPALITGIRLANVNEDFRLRSSNPVGGIPAGKQFGGEYVINTSNWLLGANIGGELISQNEFYYWGLRGRASPCLTFADMNQAAYGINTTGSPVINNPNPPPATVPYAQGAFSFTDQTARTTAGFIGDLTLLAGWQIKPNFSLQVGYDFLWVAGIASATRQFNLDQRDVNVIDVGGQTFYNGFSFGFNGSW